jgi:hypothetical protein
LRGVSKDGGVSMRPILRDARKSALLRMRGRMSQNKKGRDHSRPLFFPVMPGLVPGIHVLAKTKVVDGRGKPGHDDVARAQFDARFGGLAGHDLISAS